jgi:hypothetical protein
MQAAAHICNYKVVWCDCQQQHAQWPHNEGVRLAAACLSVRQDGAIVAVEHRGHDALAILEHVSLCAVLPCKQCQHQSAAYLVDSPVDWQLLGKVLQDCT